MAEREAALEGALTEARHGLDNMRRLHQAAQVLRSRLSLLLGAHPYHPDHSAKFAAVKGATWPAAPVSPRFAKLSRRSCRADGKHDKTLETSPASG